MDLSASDVDLLCLPTGAFINLDEYYERIDAFQKALKDKTYLELVDFQIKAKLKNTLQGNSIDRRWRLDGIDSQGTQLYAILLIEPLVPKRIDLFIPSQDRYPPAFRRPLGASWAFCIRDSRVNELGIANYVINALEAWTNREGTDAVQQLCIDAPFGSRLVLDRISPSVHEVPTVRFVKDFNVERQMLSIKSLQDLWNFPGENIPPVIDLYALQLRRQLHDTVSLVNLPADGGQAIFKSSLHDVRYMYHELKLLLSMQPHENVMPKPWYLVTVKDRYGGDDKVVGFILPFYAKGNLADELSRRRSEAKLELRDQCRWAVQIVKALLHIKSGPARFYSELKADNLLLDDHDNVIFIDFEQMGNWTTYSAPEIHNIEYCKRLAKSKHVPATDQQRYKLVLETHVGIVEEPNPIYDNPASGYYTAWTALTAEEQEAAEVFSLGKTLWCTFEGCADTRNSVLKAFHNDAGQEFPEYRRAPQAIQDLITDCTRGNRDGEPGRIEILRIDDKVYPRGRTGLNGEPTGTARETVLAAQQMWKQRVAAMETFLDTKARWKRGESTRDDERLLGFMDRPKLRDILSRLLEFQANQNS